MAHDQLGLDMEADLRSAWPMPNSSLHRFSVQRPMAGVRAPGVR